MSETLLGRTAVVSLTLHADESRQFHPRGGESPFDGRQIGV